MSPHDDLKEVLSRPLGELLHPHVVDNQEFWLQVAAQDLFILSQVFFAQEISHDIEDGPVIIDRVPLPDGLHSQGLAKMRLSNTWWFHEENVPGLFQEFAGPKFIDMAAFDAPVEAPIKILQGFQIPETSLLPSSSHEAVSPHIQLRPVQDSFPKIFQT